MAENMEEGMDGVEDAVRDDSEIFVCIKTPQDTQKVSIYRTSAVKQVWYSTLKGKGYFAERGMRNAESCQGVICGKFDADFSVDEG